MYIHNDVFKGKIIQPLKLVHFMFHNIEMGASCQRLQKTGIIDSAQISFNVNF